jgi:hypothetical protein
MNFQLQKLSPSDAENVITLSSDLQRMRLTKSHYLEDNPDLVWAVDVSSGHFLMRAPKRGPGDAARTFFFYFQAHLFDVRLETSASVIHVSQLDLIDDRDRFKEELTAAFRAHGHRGSAEPNFHPVFQAGL